MSLQGRLRRIGKDAIEDNITGEAAKAAFYFFLSLFPMLLVLFTATGLIGGEAAFARIMEWLESALPQDAVQQVEGVVREITEDRRPGALSLGIIIAVWASSNFFAALGDGLDRIFGVRDRSSWIRKRLKALLLMVIGGVVLIGSALALVAGPQIARGLGLSPLLPLLAWPLVFAMLVGLLWLVYYILPAHDQSRMHRELLIGAVAGTAVWLLATLAFRFYVSGVADYERMYGFLGGIIVLLLWLYITTLAFLLGGEVANVLVEERHGRPDHAGIRIEKRDETRRAS
jgi:membrane protein